MASQRGPEAGRARFSSEIARQRDPTPAPAMRPQTAPGAAVLTCCFLAFGFAYSVFVPVWEASDEPAHYSRAARWARGLPPRPQIENYEAGQPPLFYCLAGLVLRGLAGYEPDWIAAYLPPRLVGGAPPDGARGFARLAHHEAFDGRAVFGWDRENYRFLVGPHVLRWLNLSIGLLGVLVVLHAGRRFFPNEPAITSAAAAIFALNPQYLHVSASVSNDPFANLAGAFALWSVARALRGPWSPLTASAIVGCLLLLPFATKWTALPIAATAAGIVAWLHVFPRWGRRARTRVVVAGLFAGGATLWLFEDHALVRRFTRIEPGFAGLLSQTTLHLARSYWAALGWMSLELPGAGLVLSAAAGAGLGVSLRMTVAPNTTEPPRGSPHVFRVALFALWVIVAVSLAAVLKNAAATLQAQGRYLFPAAGAIALLAAAGWRFALPPRWSERLPALALMLLVGVNGAMLVLRVIPVYFQPWLDP